MNDDNNLFCLVTKINDRNHSRFLVSISTEYKQQPYIDPKLHLSLALTFWFIEMVVMSAEANSES